MEPLEYSSVTAYQRRFGDLSQLGQYASLARVIVRDFLAEKREFPQQLEHATH